MTPSRTLAAFLSSVALVATPVALAGCGKSKTDAPSPTSTAATQIQVYAASVAKVTAETSKRLSDISGTADYQSAKAASSSTRAYATAIREAATQLGASVVPPVARTQHTQLISLYKATANRLDKLANNFAVAKDSVALAARAQDLSAEVQAYSSQEQELRSGIERSLASALGPAVSATTLPGVAGTRDPG